MHEASLAQSIIEIVRQYVPPESGKTVRSVRVRVGELAGVVPDSLEFCYQALAAGNGLSQSRLDIENIAAEAHCSDCNKRFEVGLSSFSCPSCKGTRIELVSGRELHIVEIEVD